MSISKHTTVMNVVTSRPGQRVSFTNFDPASGSDAGFSTMSLDFETWAAMGSPEVLTIEVRPGDHLNEEGEAREPNAHVTTEDNNPDPYIDNGVSADKTVVDPEENAEPAPGTQPDGTAIQGDQEVYAPPPESNNQDGDEVVPLS